MAIMIISVIIPTLNESDSIAKTLMPLQSWRARGHQVILVDAGSEDDTVRQAEGLVDKCLYAGRSRSVQMNKGAEHSDGEILLFLHADTLIADNADQVILDNLKHALWGRFSVKFSCNQLIFKLIALMMNLRSCMTSIATGDQAIFVQKQLFMEAGGYPQQDLMEDIQLSKQLKKRSRMFCLKNKVVTSSRRWEKNGVTKTILLMWSLRLAYFLGVPAAKLKAWYR